MTEYSPADKLEWVICIPGFRFHTVPRCGLSSITAATSLNSRYASILDEGPGRRIQVVRHPLERLVSAWAFLVPKTVKRGEVEIPNPNWRPFEEWAPAVLDNPDGDYHTRPQVWFSGLFKPELWLTSELSARWAEIVGGDIPPEETVARVEAGEMPALLLGARNASAHDPWEEYYSDQLRARAEAVYAEDLALLP